MIVAPSILNCNLLRLGDELRKLEAAGADWIHLDVMDGHFVPNLSFGVPLLAAVRSAVRLPIDSHLMVRDPEVMIDKFLPQSDQIVFHIEATSVPEKCIELIRKQHRKAGIALNPDTSLERVRGLLEQVDAVLLMSVFPGYGGQQFIAASLDRTARLAQLVRERKPDVSIWVDGGVTLDNCGDLGRAGADVLVVGSAICRSADYTATIARLKGKAIDDR